MLDFNSERDISSAMAEAMISLSTRFFLREEAIFDVPRDGRRFAVSTTDAAFAVSLLGVAVLSGWGSSRHRVGTLRADDGVGYDSTGRTDTFLVHVEF